MKKRDFSIGEIKHILYLLTKNEEQGWYIGSKELYWKRHEEIKSKLSNNLTTNQNGKSRTK